MEIRNSTIEELKLFCEFEKNADTNEFIHAYSLDKHREEYLTENIFYKTVVLNNEIIGFIILCLDDDGRSVEFRRIVISKKGKGYGEKAVRKIDEIVSIEFKRSRIWLDVFAHNSKAIHIYKKCGYRYLRSTEHQGKELMIFEKIL
jgi:RimJ/RimL family protein N-acetyltransferase